MSNWFKRNGIHFAIGGIFLVICFLYLTPAFQGKVLGQADVIGARSTTTEIEAYKAKDTTILWTNEPYRYFAIVPVRHLFPVHCTET